MSENTKKNKIIYLIGLQLCNGNSWLTVSLSHLLFRRIEFNTPCCTNALYIIIFQFLSVSLSVSLHLFLFLRFSLYISLSLFLSFSIYLSLFLSLSVYPLLFLTLFLFISFSLSFSLPLSLRHFPISLSRKRRVMRTLKNCKKDELDLSSIKMFPTDFLLI